LVPEVHVDGRADRVDRLEVTVPPPPEAISRNFKVPAPAGAITAIQYRVPAVRVIVGTPTLFHAPALGALTLPLARSAPGAPPASA